MTGFSNGQVKTGVRRTLFGPTHVVMARITVLQYVKRGRQPLTVHIGGAQCRVISARRFQGVAKLQQIALRLGVIFQQMQ
ncbi:hypothetical protein D3C78_1837640 [compost metagenome]